jgi:hypothetical protein
MFYLPGRTPLKAYLHVLLLGVGWGSNPAMIPQK